MLLHADITKITDPAIMTVLKIMMLGVAARFSGRNELLWL